LRGLLASSAEIEARNVAEAANLTGDDNDVALFAILSSKVRDRAEGRAACTCQAYFGDAYQSGIIVVLGEPGIEHQLRKAPLPLDMWSRWPMLVRALGVAVLSPIMVLAAVVLRSRRWPSPVRLPVWAPQSSGTSSAIISGRGRWWAPYARPCWPE
jgi:hypothetical protein